MTSYELDFHQPDNATSRTHPEACLQHDGITCEPRPDHAQYISQYLALLKHDPKAIFTAAAKAAQAADYLKAFSQPAAVADTPSADPIAA